MALRELEAHIRKGRFNCLAHFPSLNHLKPFNRLALKAAEGCCSTLNREVSKQYSLSGCTKRTVRTSDDDLEEVVTPTL